MLQRIVRRLARERRPVRFLVSRVLWHGGVSRWFAVRRAGDAPGAYRVRFFPSSVSSYAWIYPDHVNEEEGFVARTLQPGQTYVDVGANVGLLALRAASVVGASGTVVAVEAHPRTARFLRENVAMNGFGNVQVESCAVGEARGTVSFSDRHSDDQNAVDPAGGGLEVPMVPLDELLPASRVPRVHLLKMDVEGFELHALRGATDLLSRVDRILIESSTSHSAKYGYTARAVYDLLRDAGFRLRRLGDTAEIAPDFAPVRTENLVGERVPA
ncbi:MAG TPA: FkbM family methyltransferase [Longimicrobium sp.]|nr:FkbM family methyltransferase [Longimicrobium sp.]